MMSRCSFWDIGKILSSSVNWSPDCVSGSSVWDSLLDTYPQFLSFKRYDAIGGNVYILKHGKDD